MTGGAVLYNALPALLVSRMRGLANAGFTLVPLGGGNDGKSPLCAFTGKGPTLRQTLGLMRERGSQAYGIRLDGHLVADADDTSPDILAAIEERLGTASVEVATPRGRHFWYRHDGGPVASLRLEGWPIDLKQGERAYVVGPGSIRPDGGEYVPLVGDLGRSALRPAKTSAPRVPSNKAEVGTRHVFLCKRARAYASGWKVAPGFC